MREQSTELLVPRSNASRTVDATEQGTARLAAHVLRVRLGRPERCIVRVPDYGVPLGPRKEPGAWRIFFTSSGMLARSLATLDAVGAPPDRTREAHDRHDERHGKALERVFRSAGERGTAKNGDGRGFRPRPSEVTSGVPD